MPDPKEKSARRRSAGWIFHRMLPVTGVARSLGMLGLAVVAVTAARQAGHAGPRGPVTPAAPLLLASARTEKPTFLLFRNESSSLERQFVEGLRLAGTARARQALRVVLLSGLDAPEARHFALRETPTLVQLASGGREIARYFGPRAIAAALTGSSGVTPSAIAAGAHPATCRVWHGPRLRWIAETDARARRVYRRFGGGRTPVPDIFKAMSLRPELMEKTLDLSEQGHFSAGYLSRRTKERIATYVSSLNGSHYCVGSHAGGLADLGARPAEIAALARGDLDGAALGPRESALLLFVRQLTLHPGEIADEDVARLRAHGWRDEQIFEAAFDASLFAFFNRVAATYGLDYPPDGWQPKAHTAPS
jgi:uncharacterized peroxidase-related enzyme